MQQGTDHCWGRRGTGQTLPAASLLILWDEKKNKGIHIFTPWPDPGCFAFRYALRAGAGRPSGVTYINMDKELFVAEWQPRCRQNQHFL